jgi:hypothetical protein
MFCTVVVNHLMLFGTMGFSVVWSRLVAAHVLEDIKLYILKAYIKLLGY